MRIRPADLIERKRNGEELPDDELSELVLAYARDEVPDYQMAAWCMAVYFNGLTGAETFALTDAMIRSGETLDLHAALGRTVVDKHSTGGVGDKTSIAVGPIVAACGVPLGKMSGRGLGHTGGTLDKLESIPGFRVELTTDEMIAQLRDVGMAIVGQSADLVPADKKLYALRDVTATVDIVSLIASSIMSKKLAAGADAIVLDVKVGDGAFMKTLEDARVLAEEMLELGRRAGKQVVCLLTDMDQPLGRAVGNALEIREALATVRGEGPADFTELVLDACARLLAFSDLGVDLDEGRARAEAAVADGTAFDVYERWIRAQGGDPDPSALPDAPVRVPVAGPARRHRHPCGGACRRDRRARARRREAHQGRRDRSLGRRAVLRQARGCRARGRRPRRGPRPGRGIRAGGRRGDPGRLRDRRHGAAGARHPARRHRLAPAPAAGQTGWSGASAYTPVVPELPEVETVRRGIAPVLEGGRIERATILDPRLVRPFEPRIVADELVGERVRVVERRGKYLVVRFHEGRALLIHLRMTGSLRHAPRGALAEDPHTRAVLSMDNGSDVAYRDVRRFGTWELFESGDVGPYLAARLGPEPLGPSFSAARLGARLHGRRAPLKSALLDQRHARGAREHLRRRGAVAQPAPSASPGRVTRRGGGAPPAPRTA